MKEEKKALQVKFHREIIVETAEKSFQSFGFEKTTMDDIAKEAGYSKATLYVYFKNKEEIFNHILLKGMNILKNSFHDVVNSDKSTEDKCYDLCFSLLRFNEEYPLHFEGILGNISIDFIENDESDVLFQIYLMGENLNKIIGEFLLEGIEKGIIRRDLKIKETIFMLWASASGIVRMAGQKEAYIEKDFQTTKNEFIRYSSSLLFNSLKKG